MEPFSATPSSPVGEHFVLSVALLVIGLSIPAIPHTPCDALPVGASLQTKSVLFSEAILPIWLQAAPCVIVLASGVAQAAIRRRKKRQMG